MSYIVNKVQDQLKNAVYAAVEAAVNDGAFPQMCIKL